MHIDAVNHLGYLIRQARQEQHMTQEQLSVKSGVSLRHIANIEKGKSSPSFEISYVLIRVLNIPAEAVLYPETVESDMLLQQTIQLLKSRDRKDLLLIKNTLACLIENIDNYKDSV